MTDHVILSLNLTFAVLNGLFFFVGGNQARWLNLGAFALNVFVSAMMVTERVL